ncbi:hypothetical protein DPMN_152580 [Dreissena polymorpha]|uniref:Uncharacterized protein n=1 Tax=Dreissena polymorpha TaxID=45954 RepID=A0A9D4FJ54_DREPO|nr:hypothetical protein DPMN_152580 [Dreissena polymorpha]
MVTASADERNKRGDWHIFYKHLQVLRQKIGAAKIYSSPRKENEETKNTEYKAGSVGALNNHGRALHCESPGWMRQVG